LPTMKRWLAFMETHSKDNLLVRWGGEWDFLGDWLWPGAKGVNGDTQETLCFNNCYWAYSLGLASRICDILGDKVSAAKYGTRANEVAMAINAKFLRTATHDYGNGDQMDLAAALLGRVPRTAEWDQVWKRLEEEILIHRIGHIYAGIIGGALMTRLLLDSDRADLMYPMAIQRDFPSWGDFIAKGHTTFPEEWDGGGSQLHSSYLFVGAWFIEGLAGITQHEGNAGFQHFEIRPLVDTNPPLDHAAATFDSPYGRILSSWSRHDGILHVRVTVPPNSTATLFLPTGNPDRITEGGKPLKAAQGVKQIGVKNGKSVIELQSGVYEFACP